MCGNTWPSCDSPHSSAHRLSIVGPVLSSSCLFGLLHELVANLYDLVKFQCMPNISTTSKLPIDMAESTSASLLRVWNKLQEKFSSEASSSRPFLTPQLKKLNDMVYEVHSPLPEEKPQLEVLFFHGLQLKHGKDVYLRTWMSRDDSHLWLKTWLVELFPKARILLISYDAATKKTDESGRMDMYCTTENLVHSLTGDEVSIGQAGCPIVLVGHCLGGLLLKELCITAAWMLGPNKAETFESASIHNLFYNLRGMFFYGTPHNGSLLGDGLRNDFKEGELVDDIKILKASSARRNQQFDKLKSQCHWYTYGLGEARETYVDCLGKSIHVVPEASARSSMDRYYSVDADHHDICKPDGKEASSLTCLGNFLNQIQEGGVCQARAMVDLKSNRGYVDLGGHRTKKVLSMLNQPETHTVFITGLSGVGKTALAQEIFHAIGHSFQARCFVPLDTIENPANNFTEQILRQIVEGLDTRHVISSHNLSSVLYYLKEKKVLIVLDNVDSQGQLDALHTNIWLKGSASKLIVTTTNARLGTTSNTFKVRCLSETESQQLFRQYAFEGGHGPPGLSDLITRAIDECGNFPLSLKILGAYASKGSIYHPQFWLDLLDRLQKAQEVDSGCDYRLWAKLRLCYNVLQPTEKEIFLDIAAFFHGFPISLVRCIWQGSRESPHIAWLNLEQRFLARVDGRGNISMHSHLRNLGKSIACPRDMSVAKWKRICSSSFAKKLIAKHQGIVDTVTLKLQISQGEGLFLEKLTFVNYVHLQYLSLEGVQATSSRVDLPRSLVYLRWTNGLFKVCPVDFTCLENLVALQLRDCRSMESLSPSIVCATKLKWLELDGCLSLTKLLRGLSKCLQHLSLERTAVRELPHDLGKLKGLTDLTVGSPHLTRIPQRLGGLGMLSSLNLSCRGLTTLPEFIGNLTGLTKLKLMGTSLTSLPDSIGQLQELIFLDLVDNRKLAFLPESICQLQRLTGMDLTGTCLKALPQSIGDLANLRSLRVVNTPLETLPDSICNLHSLSQLWLHRTQMKALPQSIGNLANLSSLNVENTPLETLPDSICNLHSLSQLSLRRTQMKALPQSIGNLANLSSLDVENTPLETLPDSICNLHSLSQLWLRDTQIGRVPGGIGELVELKMLHINRTNLRAWPQTFGQLYHLESLSIDIGPLANQHASGLYSQEAGAQDEDMALDIQSLLSQLPSLQRLSYLGLEGGGFLQSWMQPLFCALQLMPCLGALCLWSFSLVETIPDELGTLANLKSLFVVGCGSLVELPESLGELCMLRWLHLIHNPKLTRLPESLSALTLSSLIIDTCGNLQSMPRFDCHMSCSDGESSTSQVSAHLASEPLQQSTTTSVPPDPPEQLPMQREGLVELSSWRLVKCFLECPWKHFAKDIKYRIECKEMEKIRKKAIWREEREYVLDTKVAMELLEGRDLNLAGHHNRLQDISRSSYHSSSHHCAPHRSFTIVCDSNTRCALHPDDVRVMDLREESKEDIKGQNNVADLNDESDEESQEGDSQAWGLHFRGLCTFLLCCR